MEDGFPFRISGALELAKLEKILAAANQGLRAQVQTFVAFSIVVFSILPPQMELRVVKTIPVLDRVHRASTCAKAARAAVRALGTEAFGGAGQLERGARIASDSTVVAAQTQISYPGTNGGCVFAILLPDNAWGWFFPEYIGALVAVRATRLSLPEDASRSLRALCCRNHVAAHMAPVENKWRMAAARAMNGGLSSAHLGIEMDVDAHGVLCARGVLNTPFTRVVGWDTVAVGASDIRGARGDEFVGRYCIAKDEDDSGWSDDE